jgi:hypothetical protein
MSRQKPPAKVIRSSEPLPSREVKDPLLVCNVCNRPAGELRAWQAHDDRDLPLPLPASAVYIGHDDEHAGCRKKMDDHPRLYAEVMGAPGWFPICGACPHREKLACRHPKLKKNGGPGLLVKLRPTVPFGAIICPPPAGPKARATSCEGLP